MDIELDGQRYAPEAVIEALSPHILPARIARMRGALERRLGSVALGLEDLHHNHNGAACLRTAEGLGLQDVVAVELRHDFPLEPEAGAVNRKVTQSGHAWLDLHRVHSTDEALDWARARGMSIFGAGPRGRYTLEELPVERPMMLVFGNEREGLRPQTEAACEEIFRVPMFGFTESFNVSVSVGMALQSVTRRVRARLDAEGRAGDLPPTRQALTLATWCARELRAPGAILRRKLG